MWGKRKLNTVGISNWYLLIDLPTGYSYISLSRNKYCSSFVVEMIAEGRKLTSDDRRHNNHNKTLNREKQVKSNEMGSGIKDQKGKK